MHGDKTRFPARAEGIADSAHGAVEAFEGEGDEFVAIHARTALEPVVTIGVAPEPLAGAVIDRCEIMTFEESDDDRRVAGLVALPSGGAGLREEAP